MCCETIDLVDEQAENIDILDGKDETLVIQEGNYYGGGTNDYEKLKNRPKINNVELIGNKTSDELKLQDKMKSLTKWNNKSDFSGSYNDLKDKIISSGSWTPGFHSGSNVTNTPNSTIGMYLKIDNLVYIRGELLFSTSVSCYSIDNLPFNFYVSLPSQTRLTLIISNNTNYNSYITFVGSNLSNALVRKYNPSDKSTHWLIEGWYFAS